MNSEKRPADENFIKVLKEWLDKRHKRYQGYQTDLVAKRKAGHTFSFEEHLKGVIYSLLSSQTVWARVEIHLQDIDRLFFNYDAEKILAIPQEFFYDGLVKLGCNSRFRRRQMNVLHDIIRKLKWIDNRHGSLDAFVQSDTPENLVALLTNTSYKIPQIGEALAYEYLRNVGIDCCKPDVHITRFFGSDRMGCGTGIPATTQEAIECIDKISRATNISKYEIDNIIWSFCAESYGEICTAAPRCHLCPIREYCNKN